MSATKRQRGQTLIEVLIALGVIAIILSMTTALYLQLFSHFSKTSADVDAQSEARFAMGRVTQSLRQAMTDPAMPPGPPISYPTPNSNATPPVATSVTFSTATGLPADAFYPNTTYQYVTITTAATPPPGHIYPDLVATTYDMNMTQTSQTTIGRDIQQFNVMPVTQSIYDVQIITAPPGGMSQQGAVKSTFTLNSRVFISYYQ